MSIDNIIKSIRENKKNYQLDFSLKLKTEAFTNDLFYILFDSKISLTENIDALAKTFKEITSISCTHQGFDCDIVWKKFLIYLPNPFFL